ncbi:MAG: cupin-like domain-containing protein [Saprospiraceae bacterium]|nr:cupin-like domain-containing protein [Saprospiraceae bacterium]MCB9325335.1 cupin-like domain-containing protein [Lewinellaceae bacterium]
MDLTTPIQTIEAESLNKVYFEENYIRQNKPVIIKGLLHCTEAEKLWSLEYLTEKLGRYPVRVFDKTKENGTSFLRGNRTVLMKEMLNLIHGNESSNLRMFVSKVLNKDKDLQTHFSTPAFFTCKLQLPKLLFLGGKGTIVPLHFDFLFDDGLLTQFFGRKEVILIENSQSKLLCRLPLNSISLINLFEVNYEENPQLKKVKGYRVTLEHGDTLYIPSGYWHQLKYTDASMSVAFRKWNLNPVKSISTAILRIGQITVDKSLNALFRKRWLRLKVKIARSRL